MRTAEHAPRNRFHVFERRHGLTEMVERGAGVRVGPRRREASPASPASLGGADRWERKSPAPTPAATVLRGWNRTPEQPMPGAQPLPGLVDTTARKSAPTDDDSEDEGWGRG